MVHFDTRSFFRILQKDLGDQINIASWLVGILDIPRSSAYRRIKGEYALDASELLTIIQHAPRTGQLAMELFQTRRLRIFEVNQFSTAKEFDNYLRQVLNLFKQAVKSENFRFLYVARDLPIFYFLSDTFLLRYKFSTWIGCPRAEGLCELLPSSVSIAKELWDMYRSLPTEELWYPQNWQHQLHMISHDQDAGLLNEAQAEELRNALLQFFFPLKKALIEGKKSLGGALKLYLTPHFTMNNCGMLHFDDQQVMLGALHNAQHFDSSSQEMIELFQKVWSRHLETAKNISQAKVEEQQFFLDQLFGTTEEHSYNIQVI